MVIRKPFDTSGLGPHRWFANTTYVGGSDRFPGTWAGVLFFTTKVIGLGKQMRGVYAPETGPEAVLIPIETVKSIEVTGRTVAKSKVGPVIMFGLLGLAARGSKLQTTIVVHTKDDDTLYFSMDEQDPERVKAHLIPFLKLVAVPFHGESTSDVHDVADQIRKLAALRDEGLLTQAEFEAQKAKLLG